MLDTAGLAMNRGEKASYSLPSNCRSRAVKQNKPETAHSMTVGHIPNREGELGLHCEGHGYPQSETGSH